MVKRYLVFTYNDEGARGGWQDLLGAFDEEAEAIASTENDKRAFQNGEVVDTHEHTIRVCRRNAMLKVDWSPAVSLSNAVIASRSH